MSAIKTDPNIAQLNGLIAAFKAVQQSSLQAFRTPIQARSLAAFIRELHPFLNEVDDIGYGLYRDQWLADEDDYPPSPDPKPPTTGTTQEELIDGLNKAFDNLCAAMEFNRELGLTYGHLGYVVFDTEQLIVRVTLLLIARDPKQAGKHEMFFSLKPLPARRLAFYHALRQSTPPQPAQQRGLEPLPLEPELLLKRIKDGGHSGQFLADAFISAYRTSVPFPHSLGELHKLDAEAFRLFHQILHIRHISGWNDDGLYQLEQRIMAIVGGA